MLNLFDKPFQGAMAAAREAGERSAQGGSQWVSLIGAASGLGARDQGCALGPDVLRHFGLERRLCELGIGAVWEDVVYRPAGGRHASDLLAAIEGFCADLADCVVSALRHGHRFVVLGGDHSCAIGTWSAAAHAFAARGPLGLIWIDAHMDSHTPATTPSGAVHGMPLACLLGHGPAGLAQLVYPHPKLLPQHVCLVGVRSYESAEAQLLRRLGVRVIFMDELRRHGLDWAIQCALEIACEGTSAYGVTVDLDVVDPQDAPGVGTPAAGGLHGRELVDCMGRVAGKPGLVGLEIAEFNPLHDRQDMTASLICDLLSAGLRSARDPHDAPHH